MKKFLIIFFIVLFFGLGITLSVMLTTEHGFFYYKSDVELGTGEKSNKKSTLNKYYKVDDSYFDDALFIGDSRTVGLERYSGLNNADYFAQVGLTVYEVFNVNIEGQTLDGILSSRHYSKVYLMFGVNEIGSDLNENAAKFKELINTVKSYQGDAVIYIQANLHTSKYFSDNNYNKDNKRLDKYNNKLAKFADKKEIFYINVNEVYDDGDGNLSDEYTGDGLHLLEQYYPKWKRWLLNHACTKK